MFSLAGLFILSTIADILTAGMARLESDSGGDQTAGKVTYRTVAYNCTANTLLKGNTLELGGKVQTITFSVHIRQAALGNVVPFVGKQVTCSGNIYRILSVRLTNGIFALDLGEINS
jgi:hypothetical protein